MTPPSSEIKQEPDAPQKNPETPRYSWRDRFDRTNLNHLLWLFVFFTVYFALQYAYLTYRDCGDGVKACNLPDNPLQAIEDGFYFSIATETTVGYGDFAPSGFSRVLACLQALGGLAIAGLFASKITTGPTGKTRLIVKRMSGAWIEFCRTSKGVRVSLIHIRFQHGLLRYDGTNFDVCAEPNYLGIFEGSSEPTSAINGPEIWFDYSNLESDKSAFSSGRTTLRFERRTEVDEPEPNETIAEARARKAGVYDFFTGYAEDKVEIFVPMYAYRLCEKRDARLVTTRSYTKRTQRRRSELVKKWLKQAKFDEQAYDSIKLEWEKRQAKLYHL